MVTTSTSYTPGQQFASVTRNNVCPQWVRYSQHLLGSVLCLVVDLAVSNFYLDIGLLLRDIR